jgi:hypothetical protein
LDFLPFRSLGLQDILPDVIQQIGPDAIPSLKKIAEELSHVKSAAGSSSSSAAANEDEIPPLVSAE